jgi:hypothetical protein
MADDEFKARAGFFSALSQLQRDFRLNETLETALPKATAAGFGLQSWIEKGRPVYVLVHHDGHSITVKPDPDDVGSRQVIEALLGLPMSLGVEVEAEASEVFIAAPSVPAAPPSVPAAPPKPASEPAPAAPAAPAPVALESESFDLDEDPLAADPDPNDDPSTSTQPLSDEDKTVLLGMLRALPSAKSKAAIVAFRKAFSVPPGITKPSDAITELRHRVFLTRLIDEAENIPTP